MANFKMVARGEGEDADNQRSSSTRRERVRRQIDGQYVVLRDGKVSWNRFFSNTKRLDPKDELPCARADATFDPHSK